MDYEIKQRWITISLLILLLIVLILFSSYMYVNIEYLKLDPCKICKDMGYSCYKII